MKKKLVLMVAVFGVAITAASFNFGGNKAKAAVPGVNTRVSVTSGGSQSSSEGFAGVISRDGSSVAFGSIDTIYASGDLNNTYDIFLKKLSTGSVSRVTVSTSGVSSDQGGLWPAISKTGRYVVFYSTSTNLIDGRTISASFPQLYMRDTVANTTSILSEISSGVFANAGSIPLDVSTDGRFVLFRSAATNLGPTITNTGSNIFLLDRTLNSISWVNARASGAPANGNSTIDAHMSCDGSMVVFDSEASYLGLAASSHIDVFLLDKRNGDRITNITGSANGVAVSPKISCNGDYIGFASYASNLDPMTAGMSLNYHAYLYNRVNNDFQLLDQSTSGAIGIPEIINLYNDPLFLSLSDNGAAVFATQASNLDPAGTTTEREIYIRDTTAGTTELLSRDSGGTEGDLQNRLVSMTLDGKLAAYESYATNLITGDTNNVRDIYVSETGL